MRIARRLTLFIALLAGGVLVTACTSVEEITDRIQQEGEQRTDRAVDRAVEGTADAIANAVKCSVGDEQCIRDARADGKTVVMTDENGDVIRDENGDPVTASESGNVPSDANANFDFEPGGRTLYADDFSNDNVGDFPRSMEFRRGQLAVVEWKGDRYARATADNTQFAIQLPEELPETFTIELDLYDPNWLGEAWISTVEEVEEGETYFKIYDRHGAGVVTPGGPSSTSEPTSIQESVTPIRIMVDGSYAKMYEGTRRIANIPNANVPRSDVLYFRLDAGTEADRHVYIGDIRIAAGGRDLYSTLESEGSVTAQGVEFDTGSATLRPASQSTLDEVAQMLKSHPNLRLRIEGHTDAHGSDTANQTLSQKRAESVLNHLVNEHGIDARRLQAVGKGESEPVASNDTAAGRQDNRRVELVKL